jgi:hypothetical protein
MSLLGPACVPRVKFSSIYNDYIKQQTVLEQGLLSKSALDQPIEEQSVVVPGIGTYATLFSCKTLSQIYRCPPPLAIDTVIGVISLGGGLYGSVNPTTGIVTNSECQEYWSWEGISPQNQPKVIIKYIPRSEYEEQLSDEQRLNDFYKGMFENTKPNLYKNYN